MQLAKVLIITGSVLIGLGLLFWGASQIGIGQKLGKLPGDIRIEGKNFSFYFPLASSLLLSFLLSLILYLWGKFKS
jgi:hypothetical protein